MEENILTQFENFKRNHLTLDKITEKTILKKGLCEDFLSCRKYRHE